MANSTKPLTNTEIKNAKPREKEYNLADGNGLYLRVKPNGTCLWIFNYSRPQTKKRANISFGNYPTLSLAEAREKRGVALNHLANQIDPQTQREESKQSASLAYQNSLLAVSSKWLEVKRATVTSDYAGKIWASFEIHVFPKLGTTPIHLIKATSTIEVLRPLAEKNKLETLKRVIQRLNEVMVYAVNSGLIEANCLSGIGKAFRPPQKKSLPSIKPDQLPSLVKRIASASIRQTTRQLLMWQLHTMVRPGEAAGAEWSEIDFDKKLWTIPPSRMKKNRTHIIPLTHQTLQILEYMKPISLHREHIFPADRNPRSSTSEQTANMALKRMGYKDILVAHGLRSLASTTLNEHAFDPDLIETALAHVDKNEVRRAYNRAEYIEQRRVMMCWWSERIDGQSGATQNIIRFNP